MMGKMKINVLHWHAICPKCGKKACFFMDFDRDENGKYPTGMYECGACNHLVTEEEFGMMKKFEGEECPTGDVL